MVFTFLFCLFSSEKMKEEPEPPVIDTLGDKLEKLCLKPVREGRWVLLSAWFFGSGWLSSNSKTCGILVLSFPDVQWVFLFNQQEALVGSLLWQFLCSNPTRRLCWLFMKLGRLLGWALLYPVDYRLYEVQF